MVRVEAPPVAVTPPPPRDRVDPWLAVAVVVVLAAASAPWERWCGDGAFDDVERCFSAPLWGGSASLLGSVAVLLAVAFLVVSVPRLGSEPGATRIALFAGTLASITAKLTIASENASRSFDAQGFAPLAGGSLVATLVLLPSVALLVLTLARKRPRRGATAAALAAMIAVAAVAVPYWRSGLAWWGGPLAEPSFLGGGNGSGHVVPPGRPQLFAHLLFVQNHGVVPVTLDGLDIVDTSPSFRTFGTFVVETPPCSKSALNVRLPGAPSGCVYRLPGHRVDPSDGTRSVLLAMMYEVPRPGVYRSGWFRIRYHVGPLRYEVFRTDQLAICAPEPGKQRCPDDGF